MGPAPARITDGADGNHQDGAPAMPAAGPRGRAGMFVLSAAAGLALAFSAVTATTAAHATAAVSAPAVAAVQAIAEFEPCPCDKPICRPACSQSMTSGGPAATIHRQTHPAAAQATVTLTAIAVNCPPPSTSATSSDGQPGC